MGRSLLANTLKQFGRSYLQRSASPLVKHATSGKCEKQVTAAANRWSCYSSSSSSVQHDVFPLHPRGESISRAESTAQSLTRGFHNSMIVASDRQRQDSSIHRCYAPVQAAIDSCYCEQRCGMSTAAKDHGDKETISVTFVDKEGHETQIDVPVGMNILEAAHENDIELEGACEGSLACSTCHVIVMDDDMYSKLPEPTDEENDMLDLAFGLTETSRLGCQVIAQPELDGLRLALPAATRNFAVDGHVPKPH